MVFDITKNLNATAKLQGDGGPFGGRSRQWNLQNELLNSHIPTDIGYYMEGTHSRDSLRQQQSPIDFAKSVVPKDFSSDWLKN